MGLFESGWVVNLFTFLLDLRGLGCCFVGFVRVLGCGRDTVLAGPAAGVLRWLRLFDWGWAVSFLRVGWVGSV